MIICRRHYYKMFQFPAMTAYIRFCSSQMSSAALLQHLVETRPEFDSLLRQCQAHARVQGMPLSFYLLKPVKRVTEYPLLVEKLLKVWKLSFAKFEVYWACQRLYISILA